MPTGTSNGVLAEVGRLAGLAARHDETDRHLLQRFAAARDEAAFELLVRRHGALVRGVCRRVLGNADDADDAFQATFLVLATKAASVDWRAGVGPWLYQVAYRLARKARARAARRRLQEGQAPLPRPAAAPDDLTWRELRPLLDEELARLPQRYRAPLVLCYLEGKTRDEAAELLGL